MFESRLKARAHALGFSLVGIARADAYPELSALGDWLKKGFAGEMDWLAETAERRADVRNLLPGARSVIVTATLYNTNRPYSDAVDEDVARISRYAWGDDYHAVIEKRLDALVAWMREHAPEPFEALAYVDTGPVQERVYAQYAGLGWIGKNSCLINAELGSWLFLSEIITTLQLEPDAEGLEQCGSCTRCLDACPTQALVEPGVLDATRCLSYLTIELRGPIPEIHREAMGTHVYGCDVCQEVCPYNRPASASGEAAWQPRGGLDLPRLVDLWNRSDDELKALRRGTAMTRAKLTALRRNLAVAIGNAGDLDAVASLAVASEDRPSADDPVVEEHIAWAVQRRDP